MKVGIVAPSVMPINDSLAYGGTEGVIKNLIEAVKDHCDVTLIAPIGSKLEGVNVIETVKPEMRWVLEDETYNIYKKCLTDFDVINSHEHSGQVYKFFSEKPDPKIIHCFHGLQTWPMLPNAKAWNFVVLSEFHKQDCVRKYGTLPNYSIIPHGIALSDFVYEPHKSDYFLHYGLVALHKGHDISLAVTKKANVMLCVAGEHQFVSDTDYVNKVLIECAKRNVEFLGRTTQEKKIELFKKARAVILPFKIGEAFSLIAIECLATGTPVITSNIGAMPEIVEHGKTGFLCNNSDEFVEAIKNIDKINPMDCRRSAEERFDRKLMAKRYLEQYERLVKT